jgi:hypothetical protein
VNGFLQFPVEFVEIHEKITSGIKREGRDLPGRPAAEEREWTIAGRLGRLVFMKSVCG